MQTETTAAGQRADVSASDEAQSWRLTEGCRLRTCCPPVVIGSDAGFFFTSVTWNDSGQCISTTLSHLSPDPLCSNVKADVVMMFNGSTFGHCLISTPYPPARLA